MTIKKTFYQVLDIPATATSLDILTAYQRQKGKLESEAACLPFEEFSYREKLLALARDTLSDPDLRRDYDASLMSRPLPSHEHPVPGQANLVQRAGALALHADAVALRADAMALSTDATALRLEGPPPTMGSRVAGGLRSTMQTAVIVIGTLAALAMVIQTALVFFTVRKTGESASVAARTQEKIIIEDYYQRYGVKPASAAEARLLEQENQRREREEREAEREAQRAEDEARRSREETWRLAERVSADLRAAEATAAAEEAMKRARKEEEANLREAEEQERIRRQQQEWRDILRR